MKKLFFLPAILMTLFFSACEDEVEDVAQAKLTLNIDNLEASASGEQYEGWIIVNGEPVSTGTFTIDGSGNFSQSVFDVDPVDLADATDFVLSIEPSPDTDPEPSAIKILGGSFSGDNAGVDVSHPAALGSSFEAASGNYILATPTTSTTDDELSGVWFLDLSSGMPSGGLNLPVLPAGWNYEGWAVIDGTPVSTGTFRDGNMGDDSAPHSGTDASAPPFPGEDLVANAPNGLTFPTDLSGKAIVISVEPSPDNSAAPFMFKPLLSVAPADAADHSTYMLENQATTLPSGMVSR